MQGLRSRIWGIMGFNSESLDTKILNRKAVMDREEGSQLGVWVWGSGLGWEV